LEPEEKSVDHAVSYNTEAGPSSVVRTTDKASYQDYFVAKYVPTDAGVHPAHSGMASLPFIDELDWSTVDAILITQWVFPFNFHADIIAKRHQFSLGSCSFSHVHYGEGAIEPQLLNYHSHGQQTNFRDGKGKVYMTHPTKAVYKFVMQDFVRMRRAVMSAELRCRY
jgi:cleavage and polyadenylation specificity factor subunit 3